MPALRRLRLCLASALRLAVGACIAVASFAAFASANVTSIRVKFSDSASASAATPSPEQFGLVGQAMRSGIAGATATLDGAFELQLAPPLAFEAAREAINRLRLDARVLYVSIARTDGAPATASFPEPSGAEPALSRIIVKYRDPRLAVDAAREVPLAQGRVDALARSAGRLMAHQRTIGWAGAYLVTLMAKAPRAEVEAMARSIAADPEVEWAQPDYLRQRTLLPDDSLYVNQWHYFAPADAAGGANLPAAWDLTRGWSGIRMAVLDSGALFGHPDVGPRFLGGYDFVYDFIYANDGNPAQPPGCTPTSDPLEAPCISSRDADAADPGDWVTLNEANGTDFGGWLFNCQVTNSSWHGTHVAGTMGAVTNNVTGVAGVNWVGRIVPARVLGKCGGYESDVADGITWTTGGTVSGVPANPYVARVINLSLGGPSACSPLMQGAINGALARGSVVVVSAGNGNTEAATASPASCSGVITVAAVGRNGQRASYSNFDDNDGSGIQVEIAAPGGSDGQLVLSTLNSGTTSPNPGGYNYVGYPGTSMAAPHVAGVASLMLSLKPDLTPAQVTSILQTNARAFPAGTGRDCTSSPASVNTVVKYCGSGIVDAAAALTQIMGTGGPGGTPLAATTAALISSTNPAVAGAPVTFTATVSGGAPAGTVAFLDGETAICAAVAVNGAGQAQCVTSSLAVGAHPIRAVYSGSASNTPSDSPTLVQQVNPGSPQPTTTSVVSGQALALQGANVTLTATVAGTNPTGGVEFRTNGVAIAGCSAVALAGAGNLRSAGCTTNGLAPGNNAILASYGGDAFNQPSSGSTTQSIVATGVCAPFNDVPGASTFCPHVQWMYNRVITQGCDPVTYCSGDPVTRLAMAAFMNREGRNALTPEDLPAAVFDNQAVLSAPVVQCQTADYPVTSFPRRAYARATVNTWGPSASLDLSIELVVSTDGGASWNVLPGSGMFASLYAGRAPLDDRTVSPFAAQDLAVGSSYRFGVRVTRIAGSGNIGLYCVNRVQIRNRNAGTVPF